MNTSIISGNLGKDAIMKEAMANGKKYITFGLANTEKIGQQETTIWFQCFIHNEKICAGSLINYLKKGTKVLITGKQTAEIWNKPDGTNVITHSISVRSIELMGSTGTMNHQTPESMANATPPGEEPTTEKKTETKDDDDLPF